MTNIESMPEWLQNAQRLSSATWQPAILDLEVLNLFRIDEEDGGYQRPIKESRVEQLVEKFDAGEARDIYVSKRPDGSYYVLDGQHTREALLRMGQKVWSCRVFFGLSLAEEAKRFAEYQNNTRRIPAVVQFNAEVMAKDPTAVALDRILSKFFLRISTNKLRSRQGYMGVGSRSVFEKTYNLGGEKLLTEVLQLSVDTWGQNPTSFLGRMIQGMAYLLAYYDGPEFDRGRMIAVLQNTTPKQIVESIGAAGSGGAARAGAMLILESYLDGVAPNYPKIRSNSKEAQTLPDSAPQGGPSPHEYWTEDTAEVGRRTLEPLPPVKTKEEKAAEREAAREEKRQAKAAEKARKDAERQARAEKKQAAEENRSIKDAERNAAATAGADEAAKASRDEEAVPVSAHGYASDDDDWEYDPETAQR